MGVMANERLCKQPSESRKFSMEFNNILSSSETVTQITSLASEKIDGTTSDLTVGTTGIETSSVSSKSSLVTFWVSGGSTGETYRVETVITTSSGAILEGDGILYVSDR